MMFSKLINALSIGHLMLLHQTLVAAANTCEAGEYLFNNSVCIQCEAGRYAPRALTDSCLICGAGSYTKNETKATRCVTCDAGSYSTGESVLCDLCSEGKYSNCGASSCSACPLGYIAPYNGSSDCFACDAGRYSAENSSVYCSDCPSGQYQWSYASTSCIECDAGRYSFYNGSSICDNCPAGYYVNQTGSWGCYYCDPGKYSYWDGASFCSNCQTGSYAYGYGNTECERCSTGRYSDKVGSSECSDCAQGKYSSVSGQQYCYDCGFGTYSNISGSKSCQSCDAGEYTSNLSSTSCDLCQPGQYQPYSGSSYCFDCGNNEYSSTYGASACTACETGYATYTLGSSSCESAQYGYFIRFFYWPPSYAFTRVDDCPKFAKCQGGEELPRPKSNYWVDRSNSKFAYDVFPCTRGTCQSVPSTYNTSYYYYNYYNRDYMKLSDSDCWSYKQYNNTFAGKGYRKSEEAYDFSKCKYSDDELLCTQGAGGPLCGSCLQGYVYSTSTDSCEACSSSQSRNSLIVFLCLLAVFLLVLLYIEFGKDFLHLRKNPVVRFLSHLESGSLKVMWVTYQVIVSSTFSLEVKFPSSFVSFMRALSFLTFDFLSLECLGGGSNASAYYATIYLWCLVPLLVIALISVIGVIRYKLVAASEKNEFLSHFLTNMSVFSSSSSNTSSSDKITPHDIFNQHIWFFTLFTYLILPQVASKQLQVFDCLQVHSEKVLRYDTSISCDDEQYHQFSSFVIFFAIIYQMVPITWFILLYRKRDQLNVSNLKERENNPELQPLKFLFNDYTATKWWFEIVDIYRRILFSCLLPLISPRSAVRSSFGLLFAIITLAVFRELQPYRVEFTNVISNVAQVTILMVFFVALCLDTNSLKGIGIDSVGIGIMLVVINLVVFFLVVFLALRRYKKLASELQWRKALNTQELKIVQNIMNEGFDFMSSSTKEKGKTEFGIVSTSYDVNELGGIELNRDTFSGADETDDEINSKSTRHKNVNEQLSQYLLKPKEVIMLKRVGAGAFGEVFKGSCMGEPVAIKTMLDITDNNVREFKHEILLTATLRHPNIVNFVGACWGKELMCLVLEWVAKGSLRDLLETPDLKWNDPLLRLACDMARGMNYLHNRKFYDEREGETVACILHRDLKPDNALISEYTAAKLADFGTSRSKAEEDVTMTSVGTPLYVAPEIARGEKYDESVDVYSFGLTLLEMCIEQPILEFIGTRWMAAFNKKKIPKQPMRLIRPMTEEGWRPVTEDNPISFAPPSINNLINKCCNHDPSKRPKFVEILEILSGECKVEIDASNFSRRDREAMKKLEKSSSSSSLQVESKETNRDRDSFSFLNQGKGTMTTAMTVGTEAEELVFAESPMYQQTMGCNSGDNKKTDEQVQRERGSYV